MTIFELNKRFRNYFGFNAPIDMIMTMAKGPTNAVIDIIKLDKMFANRDSDYDPETCTYKDKSDVSISEYVKIKYDEEACNFIKSNM